MNDEADHEYRLLEAGTLQSVRVHAFEKLLYRSRQVAAIAFFALPDLPLFALGVYRALKSPGRLS